MRHHPIAHRLQRLTFASLAVYLTLPLSTLNYIGNVYSDHLYEFNKAIPYYQQAL
ncbi:hypothetical protein I8748_11605 [Nostoc sp. CENA67]|uniref:Tetratricopeptide repeat protein n=1 Tax=Amazonocrinis nigriterrae CENA67 TaxID=2794033 RepID=A0A8J7HSQ8_9NOST|nr:hypothetical protein [Amazonocrinis nigriterrae]MBH8562817.1 hypothetical protein [Amazonocrinis nigriterrae CENA67]